VGGANPDQISVTKRRVDVRCTPTNRGVGLASAHMVECWIGVVQQADRRVVRLAGRLSIAQVPELLGACAGDDAALELDLTELVSADTAGIEALQRLRDLGATLMGAPRYLQLKLDSPIEKPLTVVPPPSNHHK
jgi:hypothetical protein